jgi:hypothetical protein
MSADRVEVNQNVNQQQQQQQQQSPVLFPGPFFGPFGFHPGPLFGFPHAQAQHQTQGQVNAVTPRPIASGQAEFETE